MKKVQKSILSLVILFGVSVVFSSTVGAWYSHNNRSYNQYNFRTTGVARTYQSRGWATASVKVGPGAWYSNGGNGSATVSSFWTYGGYQPVYYGNTGR